MTTQATMAEESPPNAASGRRVAISRTVVNFWLDATLLVTFLVLCWISAVLQFVFPAGAAPDAFQVWGATAPDWQSRQFGVLCVFAVGILLHVMLHWSWVMGVITTRFLGRKATRDNGAQTLIGVGLLLAILHLLALGYLAARMSLTAVTP